MKKVIAVLLVLCGAAVGQATQNTVPGTITGTSCVPISAGNRSTVGISVIGTWSGTIQAQIKLANGTYGNVSVYLDGVKQSTITANGNYQADVAAYDNFQVCGATVTGTATIQLNASPNVSASSLRGGGSSGSSAFNAITAGTNTGQALVVGNGSTLSATGSGTITATNGLPSGTQGGTVVNANGGTTGAVSLKGGIDATQLTGSDAFAQLNTAIVVPGVTTIDMTGFGAAQNVSTTVNANVAGQTIKFGPTTYTFVPANGTGVQFGVSANGVTLNCNNTIFSTAQVLYSGAISSGTITLSGSTVTITGGTFTAAMSNSQLVVLSTDNHSNTVWQNYGVFTRTGATTGTVTNPASYTAFTAAASWNLFQRPQSNSSAIPFYINGAANFTMNGNCTIYGDLIASEGALSSSLGGHDGIRLNGANYANIHGLSVLYAGADGIDVINSSHTRWYDIYVQQSGSAGFNTNASSGGPYTDNWVFGFRCYECNASPGTQTGTYKLNYASTTGYHFNDDWHFLGVDIADDVACTVGILCDGTGNDDAANSLLSLNSSGNPVQYGNFGGGVITASTASPTVTCATSGIYVCNFQTAQGLVGAQLYSGAACTGVAGTCVTFLGTVASVGSSSSLSLSGNAAANVTAQKYTFYAPVSLSSTGTFGGFQPLSGASNYEFSGRVRNSHAECSTPTGTGWNIHDFDFSLCSALQTGQPTAGSGGVSIYVGNSALTYNSNAVNFGGGIIHHGRIGSSGYDVAIQLGQGVTTSNLTLSDVEISDIVDYIDPYASGQFATIDGFAVQNNAGATACSGAHCPWTIQNLTLTNLDFRTATTPYIVSTTGPLTNTSGWSIVGPSGWLGPSDAAQIVTEIPGGVSSLNVSGILTSPSINVCSDSASGSGTASICNTSPVFTISTGTCLLYSTTTANTGAAFTLNANSLGAKSVAKWLGNTTLVAGDVPANKTLWVCYDGTNWELSTIGNAPSGGTVTSIATTSPITGGTITGSGTLACSTCVTSATSLTSTAVMTGGGGQASQTPSATATLDSSGDLSLPGTLAVTGHVTLEGVTSTGATGTGKLVFASSPVFPAAITVTGLSQAANTIRLTADSSGVTATTPGTTIFTTGALGVNKNYSMHCEGTYSQTTATALDGISVQGATNAPTRIDAWASMDTVDPITGAITGSKGSIANLTTTTATPVVTATPGAAGTVYQWSVGLTIQVGASASTLNVLFFTGNASDAVVVKAGSYCFVTP